MTALAPFFLGSAATTTAAATGGLFGVGGAFSFGTTLGTVFQIRSEEHTSELQSH